MRKYVVRLSLSDQNGDNDATMFALTRVINDAMHTMAVLAQSICVPPVNLDVEDERQLVLAAVFNLDGSDMVISLPNSFRRQFDKGAYGWDCIKEGSASFLAMSRVNLFCYYRDADLRATYAEIQESVNPYWRSFLDELPYRDIWRMAAKRILEGRLPANVCLTYAVIVHSIRMLKQWSGKDIKVQIVRDYEQERIKK